MNTWIIENKRFFLTLEDMKVIDIYLLSVIDTVYTKQNRILYLHLKFGVTKSNYEVDGGVYRKSRDVPKLKSFKE